MTRGYMMKLKLSDVQSDKLVKLTIELPTSIHRKLMAYAQFACTRDEPECGCG
jgi:hypothetical protein